MVGLSKYMHFEKEKKKYVPSYSYSHNGRILHLAIVSYKRQYGSSYLTLLRAGYIIIMS